MKHRSLVLPLLTSTLVSACFHAERLPVETETTGSSTGTDASASGATTESGTMGASVGASESTTTEGESSTAAPSGCGNGVIEADEECDDAGESASCNADCTQAACGDGTLNATAGEACDDGAESAACNADCTLARCGDGVLNDAAGEECDSGDDPLPCYDDCTVPRCGDGIVNPGLGEDCDDGTETASCDGDCTWVECGDGSINTLAGEECDDGLPPANGDGCNVLCRSVNACQGGADPFTGSQWIVCADTPQGAWISHLSQQGGNFHPQLICESLGYTTYGQFGGTCGNECGYCEGETSCSALGVQTFDGGGDCGQDEGGPILCFTVQWMCVD